MHSVTEARKNIVQRTIDPSAVEKHTIYVNARYCNTDGRSIRTGCVHATKKQSAKDRQTITFVPSPCPPDEGVQTRLCVNTLASCGSLEGTVKHTVLNAGYTLGADEKGSLEHPAARQTPMQRKAKADSKDEILDKGISNNSKDLLPLSTCLQNPTGWILISVGFKTGGQRTVASSLDTCTGSSLVNSSFLPPTCGLHVKPDKDPPLRTATNQAVPVQGFIYVQICMRDFHARAWFGIVEYLAMLLLLGTSHINQCIRGICPTE